MEGELGLSGGIDINHLLGLHIALLMVDAGLNDTISDGLQAPKGRNSHQKALPLSPRTPCPICLSYTLIPTLSLETSWLHCKTGTP